MGSVLAPARRHDASERMDVGLAGAAVPMGLVAARQDPAQSSSIILIHLVFEDAYQERNGRTISFVGKATMSSRNGLRSQS